MRGFAVMALVLAGCQALPDDHALNTQLGRAIAPLRSSLDPAVALDDTARRLATLRRTTVALARHEHRTAGRLLAADSTAARMLSPTTMARRSRHAVADAGAILDLRWQPMRNRTEDARRAAAVSPGRAPARVERILQLLR